MDIRCPSCSTLYEFDEALIPDDGIHLRCSACGQAFRVRRAPTDTGNSGWFVRKAMTGEMVAMPNLGDVQKAVVERRFTPGDLLSRSGTHWKRLEEVSELEPFFRVAEETRPRRSTLGAGGAPAVSDTLSDAAPPVPPAAPPQAFDHGATLSMHARAFAGSQLDGRDNEGGPTIPGTNESRPTQPQAVSPITQGSRAILGDTADHYVGGPTTMGSGPVQVSPRGGGADSTQPRLTPVPITGLPETTDGAILKDDVRRAADASKPTAPPPAPDQPPAPPPRSSSATTAQSAVVVEKTMRRARNADETVGDDRETAWSFGGVTVGDSTSVSSGDLGLSGEWEAAAGLRRTPNLGKFVGPIALMAIGGLIAVALLRPDLLGLDRDEASVEDVTSTADDDAIADETAAPSTDAASAEPEGSALAAPSEGSADGTELSDEGSGDGGNGEVIAVADAEPESEPAAPPDAAPTTTSRAASPPATPPPPATRNPEPEPEPEPTGFDGLMQRGNELLASNPSAALEAFSAAADQSDRAEAHVGVARAYEAMGRYDLAAARYGRATRQNDRYQPAWAGLAAARQRTGDIDGAIEAWERVIRIRSSGATADRAREALLELQGAQ